MSTHPGRTHARAVVGDIRSTPLSIDEVRSAVGDEQAGAVVLFVGTVRDHDHGKAVDLVEYTCHPSAPAALQRLAERFARHEQVRGVAVVHRVGPLAVGELAVVAAVGAVHRAEAFAVCRSLIDELKATVPIWKHQTFTDGTDEWVGAP